MLTEIEFALAPLQFELMGYPPIRQGHSLTVILDAGILSPGPVGTSWFVVQKEPLPPRFEHVGRAAYAFSGQIMEADMVNDDGVETATVLIKAGDVTFRAICAPDMDGRLPYGTWETRTITGLAHFQGIVEDDFASPIGAPVGVTAWRFRRLVLTPGDPLFGAWHESGELLPVPYQYDRVLVVGKLHHSRL